MGCRSARLAYMCGGLQVVVTSLYAPYVVSQNWRLVQLLRLIPALCRISVDNL